MRFIICQIFLENNRLIWRKEYSFEKIGRQTRATLVAKTIILYRNESSFEYIGRHALDTLVAKTIILCRNESSFEYIGQHALDTLVAKTVIFCRNEFSFENIGRHAQDTLAVKTINFTGTNRACNDKVMLQVTKRIEAESTCCLPFSASKGKSKISAVFRNESCPTFVASGE